MVSERVITVQRRLVLTPRTCIMCGKGFDGWGRQHFCSKLCQGHWDYRQHAESRSEKRRARYHRRKDQQP